MRYYHYLLIFLVIAVVYRIYYIINKAKLQLKEKGIIKDNDNDNNKEGFESLTSCLEQGYPANFCKRVPLQACLTNCR